MNEERPQISSEVIIEDLARAIFTTLDDPKFAKGFVRVSETDPDSPIIMHKIPRSAYKYYLACGRNDQNVELRVAPFPKVPDLSIELNGNGTPFDVAGDTLKQIKDPEFHIPVELHEYLRIGECTRKGHPHRNEEAVGLYQEWAIQIQVAIPNAKSLGKEGIRAPYGDILKVLDEVNGLVEKINQQTSEAYRAIETHRSAKIL